MSRSFAVPSSAVAAMLPAKHSLLDRFDKKNKPPGTAGVALFSHSIDSLFFSFFWSVLEHIGVQSLRRKEVHYFPEGKTMLMSTLWPSLGRKVSKR